MKQIYLRQARRDSFGQVPETCPHIDRAAEDAETDAAFEFENALAQASKEVAKKAIAEVVKAAKEKTMELREALIEANARIAELEEEIKDARKQIKQLEQEAEQ